MFDRFLSCLDCGNRSVPIVNTPQSWPDSMPFKRFQEAFRRWRDRWTNWVGDREMELSIRRRLSSAGYYGNSAKLARVQLIALQRPGWIQVYRFEFSAKPISVDEEHESSTPWTRGYGLVAEDARKNKSDVKLFLSQSQWIEALRAATKDLVILKSFERE